MPGSLPVEGGGEVGRRSASPLAQEQPDTARRRLKRGREASRVSGEPKRSARFSSSLEPTNRIDQTHRRRRSAFPSRFQRERKCDNKVLPLKPANACIRTLDYRSSRESFVGRSPTMFFVQWAPNTWPPPQFELTIFQFPVHLPLPSHSGEGPMSLGRSSSAGRAADS
jgi:hypothetical protein